jgi:hypothetical protein
VIGQRAEIREHLEQHAASLARFHDGWWDTVAGIMADGSRPEDVSSLPGVSTTFSLTLETAESPEAARLNASNEIAIGNLAQHSDWLQGQLDGAPAPSSRRSDLIGTVLDAGQRLASTRPAAMMKKAAGRVLR